MQLAELIDRLERMGFERAGRSLYGNADRYSHRAAQGGSVFVGDADGIWYPSRDFTTMLTGTGAFMVANGRTRGMTQALAYPNAKPSGRIELGFTDGRRTVDRDTEIAIELLCEHVHAAAERIAHLEEVETTGSQRLLSFAKRG